MKTKNANILMICQTPFHLWMVDKIIKEEKYDSVDVLLLIQVDSIKIKYYIDLLKGNNCDVNINYFFIKNDNNFEIIISLLRLSYFLSGIGPYIKVYISGINSLYVQKIISKIKFDLLETYDDGVANVFYDGVFYEDTIGLKRRFLKLVFNIKVDIEWIRNNTNLHSTIYKGLKNISKKTKYVGDVGDVGDVRTFFLGQPYKEFGDYLEHKIKTVCSNLKVDFYYPHPREITYNIPCEIINSQMIIEDYIENFSKENPNVSIVVVGFISSALLSINAPNLKKIALYDDFLYSKYSGIYRLFQESKIETMDMNSFT